MSIFYKGKNAIVYKGDSFDFSFTISDLEPNVNYEVFLDIKMPEFEVRHIEVTTDSYGVAVCNFPFSVGDSKEFDLGDFPYAVKVCRDNKEDTRFPTPFESGIFRVLAEVVEGKIDNGLSI